jgi:tetraacyldisaccharide 4'-kinase
VDDEDLLSQASLEDVVRLSGRNRVALARRAISEFRSNVIVLDDGYQHYRIERDLNLVMIDATDPFAGGRMIPRGLLRERPSGLRRADLIVVSHVDQIGPATYDDLVREIHAWAPSARILEAVHRPLSARNLVNKCSHAPEWLRGRSIYAFAGIGNPESFRRTLESLGAAVVKFRGFPDHCRYASTDLRNINAEAEEFMAEMIVTTEKDAARLRPEAFELPILALRVELEFVRGEEFLEQRLETLTRGLPQTVAPAHP